MSSPLDETIDALASALRYLNRASDVTKDAPNLLDLHLEIESAWAETDDAISKARAANNPEGAGR